MKADSVAGGISGGIEYLTRLLGIMRIEGDVLVIGPALPRQNALSRLREATPDVLQERSAIDRVCDCLTYAHIAQRRVTQIEREIGERRVGKECRSRWSPYH